MSYTDLSPSKPSIKLMKVGSWERYIKNSPIPRVFRDRKIDVSFAQALNISCQYKPNSLAIH